MATATQTKTQQSTAPAGKAPPTGDTKGDAQPAKGTPKSVMPQKFVQTKKPEPVEGDPAPATDNADAQSTGADASAPSPNDDAMVQEDLSSAQRSRFVQLRKVVRTGLKEMSVRRLEVAAALLEIRDKGLYRGRHERFEDFCLEELNIARSYAYELAKAGEVQRDLQSAMADSSNLPANERQSRPLGKLKTPEERVQAWRGALGLAKGGQVTEAHVRQAVGEIQKQNKPKASLFNSPKTYADWKGPLLSKFQAIGFEPVFEQPIKWPTDAVTLFSSASNRYVKLVDTLNFTEAACVLALKERELSCLIVVNADANAPDGILYSEADQTTIDKESFTQAFHVMAKLCDAVLENEGKFYRAGDLDETSETGWAPVSYLDLELPEPSEDSTAEPEAAQ